MSALLLSVKKKNKQKTTKTTNLQDFLPNIGIAVELIQICSFSFNFLPEEAIPEDDWNQNSYRNYLLFIINNGWPS